MNNAIKIDIAATILGTCKQTLRRWDESGRLVAERDSNGYRQYQFEELQKHIPSDKARPFLKWAGGKTQLLPELLPRVPSSYKSYVEPFLGGGALFFALQPKVAKLNDVNQELVNTYIQVRDNADLLIELLHSYQRKHSKEFYYETRGMQVLRMQPLNRAARFIYLNKTCFNGLHRVNQKGQFNVPMGNYKNPKIVDSDNLLACSRALENAEIYCLDYKDFLESKVSEDDFVYLDPPYIPVSEFSDFDRYAEGKFRLGNQVELAREYASLVKLGAYPLLSNSSSELAYRLYDNFKVDTVKASRFINKEASGRGKIDEILVLPKVLKENCFPSTRYMGSKNSLLPHITEVLSNFSGSTVLDAFSGSGVVSYHFKKLGYTVFSNDFLAYASSVSKALIENNSIILNADDINFLLSKNKSSGDFVQKTFKDLYFYDEDNKFLDNTLANIEQLDCEYKKALSRASLARACLKRRPRGIFTYVGFRYDDGRKDLSFSLKEHFIFSVAEFNKAVFSNDKDNISLNRSALDLDVSSPDLVYLDPPYFSMHSDNDYVRRYHFIEGLCKNWRGLEIQEHTKTKKFKKYDSPFNSRAGTYDAFEKLLSKYKKSTFLISYSSNSLPNKDELTDMLKSIGKNVTLYEIDYKYSFGNQGHKVSNNNNSAQEYLFWAE